MVQQEELRFTESGEPVRPTWQVIATKRHKDELALLFHLGQIRKIGIDGMKRQRNSSQELDVIGAFDDH